MRPCLAFKCEDIWRQSWHRRPCVRAPALGHPTTSQPTSLTPDETTQGPARTRPRKALLVILGILWTNTSKTKFPHCYTDTQRKRTKNEMSEVFFPHLGLPSPPSSFLSSPSDRALSRFPGREQGLRLLVILRQPSPAWSGRPRTSSRCSWPPRTWSPS